MSAKSNGALGSLPSTVDELPTVHDLLNSKGIEALSDGYSELFESDCRFLRIDDETLLVFRHEDLRRLGPDSRAANLPFDIYMQRTYGPSSENPLFDKDTVEIRRFQRNQFFTAPPASHGVNKRIFAKPLAPKGMPPFAAIAKRHVSDLIEAHRNSGPFDLIEDFGFPLAIGLWGDIFDLDEVERRQLRKSLGSMTPIVKGVAETREELVALNNAIPGYLDTLANAMKRCQEKGGHPFLHWMAEQFAAVTDPPEFMPDSLELAVAANLIDGFHAMSVGVATTLHHLTEAPDAFAALRSDPAASGIAVDEALRMNSPVSAIQRYVSEDIDLDGLRIPAGKVLVLHWNAGNYDPAVHDAPLVYNPFRPHRPLLTFGGGIQICPGRNIARTMGVVAVQTILEEKVELHRAGVVEWDQVHPAMPRSYPKHSPVQIRSL